DGQPREPEAHRRVGLRARRRRCDLKEGGSGTGSRRRTVIDAIERQSRQRASVDIRGRGDPRGIEDARVARACQEEYSAECQTDSAKPSDKRQTTASVTPTFRHASLASPKRRVRGAGGQRAGTAIA